MPRVLRIINRLNLGGPTYNVAYLTAHLGPEYETLLVSGKKDKSEKSSGYITKEMGIKPVFIPHMKRSLNPVRDRMALKELKKIIREFKPDIVHTHAAKSGTLGRYAAIQCNVPVIIHTFHGHIFHSYFNKLKTRVFLGIERYLASKSTAIVAISERQKYELTEVHKVCPADKVHIIPLGFDLDRFQENQQEKRETFRNMFKLADDEIAIGIIGRLVAVKNHELFLRAFAKIAQMQRFKIRGFIIGDGEERTNIEQLARDLNLEYTCGNPPPEAKPLTFTSWLKKMDYVNAGLDVVALTSMNEGTPVSLIEAQAANRPVVSTRVGGIEDVVIEGKTGYLSDVADLNGFTANLLRVIEDPATRNGIAEQGYPFVREKFHYDRLVSDTKALYDKLLKEI